MNTLIEEHKSPLDGGEKIPGAGADALQRQRPGVPMEKEKPAPAGNAHWLTPDRMDDPGFVLKRANLEQLTPVFGTTVPPRGLSGLIRKSAYEIPEHFTSHWLLLLTADRIDVLEDRLKPYLPLMVAGGLYLAVRSLRAKKKKTLLQRVFT